MPVLLVFATAALVALLVTPAVARVVTGYGLYGHVRPSAAERRVPRLGGIAVWIATTAGLVAGALAPGGLAGPDRFFVGALLAGTLLFAAGLTDDLVNLRPSLKLLAQCAAAVVAYAFGFRIEAVSFGEASMQVGALALPLTLLWIVGVTNAFNLIDGLDGLATGIGLVALATTLAVALVLGNLEVALGCAALGGALAGFLRYNFRPARIFLGDGGSLFVGFMLAVLSVHGSTKSTAAVVVCVPLLVLALPLLDTLLAIVRRWLRGTPVFGADERHLHHQLLAMGVTHVRAVVLMYVAAATLAVLGVLLAFGPPSLVAGAAVAGAALSVLLLLFAIKRLGYHEFVEAGAVVHSGMRGLRQSIRDQIHARDVAQVLPTAESLLHVQAILQDNAPALGLLYITVCRESSREGGRGELPRASAASAWKLECPVDEDGASTDPYVLRVWTEAPDDLRLLTADRTARVLAHAVGEWLRADRAPPPVHAAPERPRRVPPAHTAASALA
ncbi:MAG TPA: MraY family glycosyltransferase [Longimicrobium sp.]|uniref:MraY family glycosyltransferase n=1 Tax=Longimicrobium sp. TaxID=2029185 RepID=UPI002EDAEE25